MLHITYIYMYYDVLNSEILNSKRLFTDLSLKKDNNRISIVHNKVVKIQQ